MEREVRTGPPLMFVQPRRSPVSARYAKAFHRFGTEVEIVVLKTAEVADGSLVTGSRKKSLD